MNWTWKHRIIVISIILVFIVSIIIIGILFSFTKSEEICTNEGVPIECGLSVQPLTVPLVRYVRTGTRPDVVAYITNDSVEAYAKYVEYRIDVYTESGDLFATKNGLTEIPNASTKAIFIPRIASIAPENARAFLTLINPPVYVRANTKNSRITQNGFSWDLLNISPRLIVDIKGDEFNNLYRVPAVVVVFDENDDVVGVSRSVIQSIQANSSGRIIYTWKEPFVRNPARIEIIFNI